ncbi:MAG: hypothetical protein K940chlam9_00109 [Chlamydiae bacterium]|nr:hypothetical protein [Chlamydiota bacterium]
MVTCVGVFLVDVKKTFFLISLCLLLFLALFPKEVLLFCVKGKMKQYARTAIHAKFSCDELIWERGEISCFGGRAIRKGSVAIHFSKLTFRPSFSWKKRELGGRVVIEGMEIVHRKKAPFRFPNPPYPSLPFFSLHLKSEIPDGKIRLLDHTEKAPYQQNFSFSFTQLLERGCSRGRVAMGWDGEDNPFVTEFCRTKEGKLTFSTQFQNHSLPHLAGLANYFFPESLPNGISDWRCYGGEVAGDLEATFLNRDPLFLKGKMEITDVKAKNGPLELLGGVDQMGFDLDIDFTTLSSMHGEISLSGGRLSLEESRAFWEGMWDLKDLHSKVKVRGGKVETSRLEGSFMGMEGELHLDWDSKDKLVEMEFHGEGGQMQSLLPEALQEGFAKAFAEDTFLLTASLERAGKGLELVGELRIREGEGRVYPLSFGCFFGEGSLPLGESDLFSSGTSLDGFLENLKEQFCLSQKRLGWFRGEHFPLEKFFTPFFLRSCRLEARGDVDLEGKFDEKFLAIGLGGERFSLEGSHFHLDSAFGNEEGDRAIFYFDLENGKREGFLPIQQATYFQKKQGFTLEEGRGLVQIFKEKIELSHVSAKWEDLLFSGRLEIDIHSSEDIDLTIAGESFSGPVSSVQGFISHFSPSFIWKLPVDGEVKSEEDPFFFHYHFTPKAELVGGSVKGVFKSNLDTPLFTLSEYQVPIFYDVKEKRLQFEQGEGNLLLPTSPGSFHLLTEKTEIASLHNFFLNVNTTLQKEGELPYQLALTSEKGEEKRKWKVVGEGGGSLAPLTLEFFQDKRSGHISECRIGSWEGLGAFFWDSHNLFLEEISGKNDTMDFLFSGVFDWAQQNLHGQVEFSCKEIARVFPKQSIHGNIACEGMIKWKGGEELEFLGTYHLKEGPLPDSVEGELAFNGSHKDPKIDFTLPDGLYHIGKQSLSCKNLRLFYDSSALACTGECEIKGNPFGVFFSTEAPAFNRGSFALSEEPFRYEELSFDKALVCNWEKGGDGEIVIQKIEGSCQGITCLLKEERTDLNDRSLQGKVAVDVEKASPYFPDTWQKILTSLSVEGVYVFEGNVELHQETLSPTRLRGDLRAENFQVRDVTLTRLDAHVDITPEEVYLDHVSVRDWAGSLFSPRIYLSSHEGGDWALACNSLSLENFHLSRLDAPWTKRKTRDRPFLSSLFVRSFVLEGFSGFLSDPSSFKGKGEIRFANLPRKTFLSNLLFLPSEITARIGLDLTSLIPAMGTIVYSIEEGRVSLLDFQEMYSNGKHSRFYLAPENPAYIDFAGNLNVKIKMKQYSLLLKLAELFTITIQGTLANPTYSLQSA